MKSFDNGMYTGMILIDPQKGFSTTRNKTLIDRLLPIRFSKNMISLHKSCWVECHFTVEVVNSVLKWANISCGVPQTSILGPVLFLIYVNDISQAVECILYLYVDDSCLLFQHNKVTKIKKQNSSPITWAIYVIGL